MTRKTVVFHLRESFMSVLVAGHVMKNGGQASLALGSRSQSKMKCCVILVGPFLG